MHIWQNPHTFDYWEEDNDSEDDGASAGPAASSGRAKLKKGLTHFYSLDQKKAAPQFNEKDTAKNLNELLNKAYFKGRNLKLAQMQAKLASKAQDKPDFDILRVREGTLDLLEFVPNKKDETIMA